MRGIVEVERLLAVCYSPYEALALAILHRAKVDAASGWQDAAVWLQGRQARGYVALLGIEEDVWREKTNELLRRKGMIKV